MHFHYEGVFAESGARAAVGNALVYFAVYFGLYAVHAGRNEHLVCGVHYICGGEAEHLAAPAVAFAHPAAYKVLPAEQGVRLAYLTLFYALFDERGAHLFAVYSHVLYRHVPYGVVFVVGVIFERGRLALCACAEAEIFAAHVAL